MEEVLISLENISKRFGERELFRSVTFGIHKGDKIGLIGHNGCGKSTFLKMLSGYENVDNGSIIVRNGINISYLPQIPILNPEFTIMEQILNSNHPHLKLLKEYYSLNERYLKDESHKPQIELILQKIETAHAWDAEVLAKNYLSKMGIHNLDKKIEFLSGGEKRRIDLARVLMDQPDVLILDEPTNHLDIDTIEWLQDYLKSYKGTLIFVTHDRYFLDDVSNKIMEIDRNQVFFYNGNYSFYLKQKELQITDLERKETRRKAQLQKELKWLHRGAQARTSKPKNHLDRVRELIDKSYLTKDKEMEISFKSHRLGKTILEAYDVSMKYDKVLFQKFSHVFQKMERIGIIGENGAGKTTLLKVLVGDLTPQSGKIKVGVNTKFAYFRQNIDEFNEKITVLDYIKKEAEFVRTKDGTLHSATKMLERFLFDAKMQRNLISTLSGGEKKRLYLLKSLIFGANFIILDEPTNDLDIRTLEILEDYLDAFDGCLLIVSHDRYFLDRVVDYLFVVEDGVVKKFAGNYSDYLLVKKYQTEENKVKEKTKSKQEKKRKSTGLNYNERKELAALEVEISEMEAKIEYLNAKMINEAAKLSPNDFREISEEISQIESTLEVKMERWAELEAKKEEE